MPAVEIIPLRLAELELPPQHPEGPGRCEVFAFLVRDGHATFLIDTGVGEGNATIEALYKPRRAELSSTLARHGLVPGGLSGIANSHLHFDHCGNNRLFPGIPIFVQRAEYEAARAAHYTVRRWVEFDRSNYQVVQGRQRLSPPCRAGSHAGAHAGSSVRRRCHSGGSSGHRRSGCVHIVGVRVVPQRAAAGSQGCVEFGFLRRVSGSTARPESSSCVLQP